MNFTKLVYILIFKNDLMHNEKKVHKSFVEKSFKATQMIFALVANREFSFFMV